jgi:hypothetical protein
MAMGSHQETARIYDFAKARARRDAVRPAPDQQSPKVVASDFGSGWYHEAAIQEADRSRKS